MKIATHPLYLAPIPIYAAIYAASGVLFDDISPFIKQTFRNRALIATENGAQALTIPVVHDGRCVAMRDVRISEHGNWRHQHWNALVSAYRKSPFFEYYADDFAHFYEERDGFLMDFNLRLHSIICELLGLERRIEMLSGIVDKEISENVAIDTPANENTTDLRYIAEPKIFEELKSFSTQPYYQVFAQRNGFISNLSILDLLFNMGPEGLILLSKSKQ